MKCFFLWLLAAVLIAQVIAARFDGSVKGVSSKDLVIETADGNVVEFRLTRKTKIQRGKAQAKASDIQAGMKVVVEASRAPDNSLEAVKVDLPVAK